jgi:hypothetical protein
MEAEGRFSDVIRFRARGLLLQVGLRHFLAGLTAEQRERAEAYLAAQETDGVHAP